MATYNPFAQSGQVFGTPINRSQLLAQMLAQGRQPIQGSADPVGGIANIANALLGGVAQGYLGRDMLNQRQGMQATMGQAAQMAQTAKPWLNPDTGQIAPGTTKADQMARVLASNPNTQPLALQMQFQQMQRQQEIADKLRMAKQNEAIFMSGRGSPEYQAKVAGAKTGAEIAAGVPKTRTVKRNGIEVTEQFDPATRTWKPIGESGIGAISPEAEGQKVRIAQAGKPTNIGTIPKGYQLSQGEGGTMRMEPIPGSPAALKAEKAARAEEQRGTKNDVVLQDIGRTLDLVNDSTFPTTGFAGDLLSDVGGTAAHDVNKMLDSIRANVGFEQLQQMRNASPTGGALGQVTERENTLLQSVLGSLEQSQSKEQFEFNLRRLNNIYLDIVHGPGKGPERMPLVGTVTDPNKALREKYGLE